MTRSGGKSPYGVFTGSAGHALEVRLRGDSTALTRFVMTLQNKRVPVRGLTLGRDGVGLRVTLLLEGEEDEVRRHATLLANLEDVEQIEAAEDTIQVALVRLSGDWREPARRHGVEAHESDGTVVASGAPERVEGWLAVLDGVEEAVRLGPTARPGTGGE